MRNIKSVLAMIVAVCLMMCLAVPAFATEATGTTTAATTDTTAATDDTTAATGSVDTSDEAAGDVTAEVEDEHDHSEDEELSTDDVVIEEEPESGFVKVLRVVLLVLEVIASVALIVVVLLQSGKEAGLSGALSGNSDSYMSKNGGSLDKVLASATKWIALAWILITLFLALI